MIGDREPHMIRRPGGGPLTLLDCQLGGHTGHFPITRIDLNGRSVWACDACGGADVEAMRQKLGRRAA